MSYNTRLGICIPTYKRPDQLRQCVDSLIASAAPYAVPIFISDDSTDETNADVIAELQGRYPHIIYEKNAKNLGIDRNILHCVDICRCEYAWLMGEDDRMKATAVSSALNLLDRCDAPSAFIAANYSSVDEHIQFVIKERLMAVTEDTVRDAETFFRQEAPAIGFMGGCIVNLSLWRSVDPAPYLDTYFAHAGRILESVHGKQVHIIAEPQVLNRSGGAHVFTWSDDAYGVFHGWEAVIHRLEPIYGADACRACIESFHRLHGVNTLRFLCAKRADNVYNLDIYRRAIQQADYSPLYKIAAFLIACASPKPFALLRSLLETRRTKHNPRANVSG